uniref:Uncharacterized protein n=2 Tax=Alexandrium monilatum TaxID=311494 RepID=A0A7S4PVY5_9DINO|mmetsp:Transcript_25557/g.76224  ORF Transcript_25557/g.76224 Transcript_25557/m.76224 type:complete len:161 (+) Transcript_25557:71-553(+)
MDRTAMWTPRNGDVEVFWLASGWRRSLLQDPPELVEDLVKQFLDEPAGWRHMLRQTASALDRAAAALASSGSRHLARVNCTSKRRASLLRVVLDNLDSSIWCMGREEALSGLAWQARELYFALAGGDPEAGVRAGAELESMASGLLADEAVRRAASEAQP